MSATSHNIIIVITGTGYGAVIMLKALRKFTWFMRWMQHSAKPI